MRKAHPKSTRKANILDLGQPLKTEGRFVNLPLARTFQQEVVYTCTRKLKQSLNKRLEQERAVMQKGPKLG